MKNFPQSLFSKFSNASKLPLDALGGDPQIELYADRLLLVEGSFSFELYEREKIILHFKKCRLQICGKELFLESLCENGLSVTGRISSLEYI